MKMSEMDTEDEDGVFSFVDMSSQPEDLPHPLSADVGDGEDGEGMIAQLMDIREPLHTLRNNLQNRLQIDLQQYSFWLQDSQLLEPHMNLVDQCVQGEGLVQILCQIKSEGSLNKINIIDVLKPPDDPQSEDEAEKSDDGGETELEAPPAKDSNVTKWVVCSAFRREQESLKIPTDPSKWNVTHVQHWLRWAAKTFQSASITLNDWLTFDGVKLCNISHADFKKKVPVDPRDLFWTHLELLRKCKFVAVVQKATATATPVSPQTKLPTTEKRYSIGSSTSPSGIRKKKAVTLGVAKSSHQVPIPEGCPGNRSGNNGQIQLWQFLLELLTDKEHRRVIQWQGIDGEFKLVEPEIVAQLWGARKNKPKMNYEKMSRSLRYYYDGDMISKVHGKRFVYKFVCDLKQLIGYSARELSQLVLEAENRFFGSL